MHKWGMVESRLYIYGLIQTIKHFIEELSKTMFSGEILGLRKGDHQVLAWLLNLVIRLNSTY